MPLEADGCGKQEQEVFGKEQYCHVKHQLLTQRFHSFLANTLSHWYIHPNLTLTFILFLLGSGNLKWPIHVKEERLDLQRIDLSLTRGMLRGT